VDRSQAYGRQTVYGAAVVFPMLEAHMLKRGALSMAGEVFYPRGGDSFLAVSAGVRLLASPMIPGENPEAWVD
jgi:hypothetical protein